MNQFTYKAPELTHLMNKLRIKILPKYRRMRQPEGPEGRLKFMQQTVNAVIKYERIETSHARADEARGYIERLISDAIKYGDSDQRMMEMADYWLREKQLVHKLFKVLVPRFIDCPTAYTNLYKAPLNYPEFYKGRSVLELKGNPFPPLVFNGARNKNLIHNILLDEARKEFYKEKQAKIAEQVSRSEKEQTKNVENTQKDEKSLKAAREVPESEQVLKSVASEMNDSSEGILKSSDSESCDEISKSDSDESKEATKPANGREFDPSFNA